MLALLVERRCQMRVAPEPHRDKPAPVAVQAVGVWLADEALVIDLVIDLISEPNCPVRVSQQAQQLTKHTNILKGFALRSQCAGERNLHPHDHSGAVPRPPFVLSRPIAICLQNLAAHDLCPVVFSLLTQRLGQGLHFSPDTTK